MSILSIGIEKGKVEGRIEGRIDSILRILSKRGPVPEALKKQIKAQTDPTILDGWIEQAVLAVSVEAFETAISFTEKN